MDAIFSCLAISLSLVAVFIARILFRNPRNRNQPPGPRSLPIIGHLHLLSKPLHRSLAALSLRHGPILLLRFGTRRVLVVSSPAIAEECFTRHDVNFANRPRLLANEILGYGSTTLASASYGPHWRNLRRIATIEVLSAHRITAFAEVRAGEVRAMARRLFRDGSETGFVRVKMKSRLWGLSLNVIMMMVAGKRRTSRYLVNKCGLDKLVHIIDDNDLPLSFQCEALLVLRKIFCSALPDLVRMDMSYLFKLVMIVEKATESSVATKKCLDLHLLGDILCSLRARRGQPYFPCDGDDPAQSKDFPSGGDGPAQIVCRAMSLIINHIASLMTQVVGCGDKMIYVESTVPSGAHSEMKQECKIFFRLILHLARVYPSSGLVALDMIRYLIQTLIRVHEKIIKPDLGLCEGPHTEMDSENRNELVSIFGS